MPETLTPPNYRPRLIDETIERSLGLYGAICIEGPKWCGKTWTGKNHALSEFSLNDPRGSFYNLSQVRNDVYAAFDGEEPHLIDEWQECPEIWDATKIMVDEGKGPGRFILTGSSTPKNKGVRHNGTGRIGLVRMRPMSLYESGDSKGTVSLMGLFNNTCKTCRPSDTKIEDIIGIATRGGWPYLCGVDPDRASELCRSYIESIVRSASHLDGIDRNESKMRLLIRSLARNESTIVSNSTLASDIAEDEDNSRVRDIERQTLSAQTIPDYINNLQRVFMVDDQPAFSFNARSKTRINKSQKRHLADPSLSIAALGMSTEMLKDDLKTFGFMFEGMCVRDLRVYADTFGGTVSHYRDDKGREVDAIVQLPNGKYAAFEIKLGEDQTDTAARNLLSFDSYLEKNELPRPEFLCVINGLGVGPYRRDDDVLVVPITHLKNRCGIGSEAMGYVRRARLDRSTGSLPPSRTPSDPPRTPTQI